MNQVYLEGSVEKCGQGKGDGTFFLVETPDKPRWNRDADCGLIRCANLRRQIPTQSFSNNAGLGLRLKDRATQNSHLVLVLRQSQSKIESLGLASQSQFVIKRSKFVKLSVVCVIQ